MNPQNDNIDANVDDDFEALRRQFLTGLPRRATELAAAADEAARHATLHKLVGAAGAYGYDQLSEFARRAMEAQRSGDGQSLAELLACVNTEIIRLTKACHVAGS